MRRTAACQGVRMLKFVDVFSRWEASALSQLEAAELLGMGERTFRRWCRRYEDEGEAGLLDRRIGKTSGKRVPVDRCEEVEALYRRPTRASPRSIPTSTWCGITGLGGATKTVGLSPQPACTRRLLFKRPTTLLAYLAVSADQRQSRCL